MPDAALAHSSNGTASVVRLPSGERLLTLTDFRTDNGPDLRVYLVAGSVNGDRGRGRVHRSRALKGNVGNQQYDVPEGTDLDRYGTIVVCGDEHSRRLRERFFCLGLGANR